jgi:hypothetical protein
LRLVADAAVLRGRPVTKSPAQLIAPMLARFKPFLERADTSKRTG